jgi:hypothetical protein
MTTSTPPRPAEAPPVRPEDHLGFACAATRFSALIARIYAEQSARRAHLALDRARQHLTPA